MSCHESIENDSPYPEVRSAVANVDDPFMPVSTLRAWFIGILFSIILPGINQFFYFRYPTVVIGGVSPSFSSFRLLFNAFLLDSLWHS